MNKRVCECWMPLNTGPNDECESCGLPFYSEAELKLAGELGALFGGTGLTHDAQVKRAARRLAEDRREKYEATRMATVAARRAQLKELSGDSAGQNQT